MSIGRVVAPDKPVKPPPQALTDDEMIRLLRAFTRGKVAVEEADVLVVVHWAIRVKWEGVMLAMILVGDLTPSVKDGQVCVGLPDMAQH